MRDIRLSSRLGLGLEVISVAIIALVCLLSWKAHGFALDVKQNQLTGSSFGAIAQSIVFGIFSFVGFESAANLGKETRNPKKVIPRAVILAPILAGAVFIVTTYLNRARVSTTICTVKLGRERMSPLMADIVPGKNAVLTILVYIGAMVSCFACALASINSFSRILFSLGRYQFVHKTMGNIHKKHQTPHLAVVIGRSSPPPPPPPPPPCQLRRLRGLRGGQVLLPTFWAEVWARSPASASSSSTSCAPSRLLPFCARPVRLRRWSTSMGVIGCIPGMFLQPSLVGSVTAIQVPTAPRLYSTLRLRRCLTCWSA